MAYPPLNPPPLPQANNPARTLLHLQRMSGVGVMSIDYDLRQLFARKAALEAKLAVVNQRIKEDRAEWMRQHNVWGIREERLKKELGL